MRLWNKATGEPWAITEPALQTILEIAARQNEAPEAVAAKLGRDLRNTYTVIERDGVAIIPVVGPLFRYANLFTQISGASSYEILARDFTVALENPEIQSIILDIDSPGGEVNGVAEFAEMIYAARGIKPVIAYASGDAASGAYWIAAAADKIVTSPTSALGSIGVVGVFRSKSGKKEVENAIEIVSSQSPYKRLDPSTDEGFTRLQTRINDMAKVFIQSIGQYRNVDAVSVQEKFGSGDVLIGAAAVEVGLADRLGSLESLISQLSGKTQNPPESEGFLIQETHPTKEEHNLMDIATLQAEHPDVFTEALKQGKESAVERIQGILTSETAEGRSEMAQELAFNTELSVEQAQAILATAPKEAETTPQTPFAQVMATVENPAIEPDGEDDEEDTAEATAKRIASY